MRSIFSKTADKLKEQATSISEAVVAKTQELKDAAADTTSVVRDKLRRNEKTGDNEKYTEAALIAIPSESKGEIESEFKRKISEQLLSAFELVIKERESFYQQHPDVIPNKSHIASIISEYSIKNAAITGSLSLVPGPWGLVAAIPEIIWVTKNQIAMVYDIGMAYGQKTNLNKEVLMYIIVSSLGSTVGALAVMHGSKVLIKRASLRVMQSLIKQLAGKITQSVLKSMVAKWLPIVGAGVLAYWSKISTSKIGAKASEIFEHGIEYDEKIEVTELADETISEELLNVNTAMEREKILCYIGLMKIDGKVTDDEMAFVSNVISDADIPEEEKRNLQKMALGKDKIIFNLEDFVNNPGESLLLLIDLIALAKRDDQFAVAEKLFIKQVAKQLNFSEADITELLLESL